MIRRFIYSFSNGEYLHLGGIIRAFVMCLRGSPMSIRTRGIILLGSHSSILNPSNLEHSGFLKIENNCIIQCHSNRPIKLGREVSFGAFSQLRPSSLYGGKLGSGCTIGSGTTFGPYTYIGCAGDISIGSDSMFGPRVTIIAEEHNIPNAPLPIKNSGVSNAGIKIGSDCWVGANVCILDGSNVGDGCVIAAGAVVKGDFPSFCIIGGVPAKILRYRNESVND